jgi:UDP-N-acetylglucosamine--N-acetylmuramyl-(pentapeptide) pyrophosphoryl-undecaprenol N-acetylglucosamine transferase
MKSKPKTVILVGGGTGGHIFPLVALGEELAVQKRSFVFVGAAGGREEAIARGLNWDFRPIAAGKVRRYITVQTFWANTVDLGRTVKGFFQSLRLLLGTGATAVFSKGGYVAFPMVCAAWVLRRPVYIHESDAVMGLTNRISARFAEKVYTAFSPQVFPQTDDRFMQIGIPIRKVLRQAARLRSPQKTRPLILVLGGIQGAAAVNALVRQNLRQLVALADVVHVTGEREIGMHEKVKRSLDRKEQAYYKPFAFLDRELAYYFQAADIVVGRAGAMTIAEAALFGRAMFLIPLPSAAGNHQVLNARILEKEHAAVVLEEHQLSPEKFITTIANLLSDTAELSVLGLKLKSYFYNEQAIGIIIKELYGE